MLPSRLLLTVYMCECSCLKFTLLVFFCWELALTHSTVAVVLITRKRGKNVEAVNISAYFFGIF